jgi:hypothetical protein
MDAGVDAGPPHLPCAVETVLKTRCQGCHGPTPAQGAPFSLLTQEDFLKPYRMGVVAQYAYDAIDSDFMPLNGPPLNAADRATMLNWIDAGVPVVTETCP